MFGNKGKKFVIFLGDLALLYTSLILALSIRYRTFPPLAQWEAHKYPFTILFLFWLLIFYIAELYDLDKFLSFAEIRNRLAKSMIACLLISILPFYFVSFFNITPKTNLFINLIIAFFFLLGWRKAIFTKAVKSSKTKVFFFSEEENEISNFIKYLNERSQLGFAPVSEIEEADIIVVPERLKKDKEITTLLYKKMLEGKTVIKFEEFYEALTGKIPVSLISEDWFLENLREIEKKGFEKFKRITDIVLGLLLFPFFLAVFPFAALAIKANSRGPIFFRQKRVGKNGKVFELIKFRSMRPERDKKEGWGKPEGKDRRLFFVGKILRKTRIDELPQLINVIKGDISFIGPRPERPEFVEELEKEIPYYSIRHIIKPGLSGWAQIHFSDASAKDAFEKLQYDLYYIKNRSVLLDAIITLKTLLVLIKTSGK